MRREGYDPRVLYGRDAERSIIGGLLEGARESRSGVLVIRGEAGVGKSALLEDARE
jgi:predicted ATPase